MASVWRIFVRLYSDTSLKTANHVSWELLFTDRLSWLPVFVWQHTFVTLTRPHGCSQPPSTLILARIQDQNNFLTRVRYHFMIKKKDLFVQPGDRGRTGTRRWLFVGLGRETGQRHRYSAFWLVEFASIFFSVSRTTTPWDSSHLFLLGSLLSCSHITAR